MNWYRVAIPWLVHVCARIPSGEDDGRIRVFEVVDNSFVLEWVLSQSRDLCRRMYIQQYLVQQYRVDSIRSV